MKVIRGNVLEYPVPYRGRKTVYGIKKIFIRSKPRFIFAPETIHPHILIKARLRGIVECIGEILLLGHPAPGRTIGERRIAVGRKAIFKPVAVIRNYIFGNTPQVEDQLAPRRIVGIFNAVEYTPVFAGDKRIEHPEINVLDIVFIKIHIRCDGPRNTGPV